MPARGKATPRRRSTRQRAQGPRPDYTLKKHVVQNDRAAAEQQLVIDMNAAAGKNNIPTRKTRAERAATADSPQNTQKRRRGVDEDERPSKSKKVDPPADASRNTPRSGLPSVRKNTADPMSAVAQARSDIYAPGADVKERWHKKRQLNQPKAVNPSPLKGQGVVPVDNLDVDLDDTTDEIVVTSPAPELVLHNLNRGGPQEVARTPQRGSPRKSGHVHGERQVVSTIAESRQPVVKRKVENNRGVGEGKGQGEDGETEEDHQEGEDKDEESEPDEEGPFSHLSQSLDPGEPEEAEVKARMISGIESAIAAHGCTKLWTEMLYVASDIYTDNKSRKAETQAGLTTVRAVREASSLWKREGTDFGTAMDAVETAMSSLREINPTRDKVENRDRARDLYQKIIPQMVKLLHRIVRTVQPTDHMTFEQVEPVLKTLKYICVAASKAMKWEPRPSTLRDVLGRIHRAIAYGGRDILKRYASHYDNIATNAEAERAHQREEQRVQAARQRERSYRKYLALRLRAVREQNRRQLQASLQLSQQSHQRQVPRAESRRIVDIDDVVDDDPEISTQHQTTQRPHPLHEPSRTTHTLMAADDWAPVEEAALLNGLERFTGPNRLRHILDEYGDHELYGRDVKELKVHSVAILHAMPQHLTELPHWLTSVVSARCGTLEP